MLTSANPQRDDDLVYVVLRYVHPAGAEPQVDPAKELRKPELEKLNLIE